MSKKEVKAKKCKCGAEVSKDAKVCPECGAKILPGIGQSLLIVGGMIVVLYWVGSTFIWNSPATAPVTTSAVTPAPSPVAAEPIFSASDKTLLKKSYADLDPTQKQQLIEIGDKYIKLSDSDKEDIKTDYERLAKEKTTYLEAEQNKVLKTRAKTIPYKELARTPYAFTGQDVKYKGQVIQVQESGDEMALRVNVTKTSSSYKDTMYVTYTKKSGEGRILNDDIVNFWGNSQGLFTYKTVLGAEATIPSVKATIMEVVK
ncbi:MAG TPA: zinc ribbon domain-containing protein [Desulfosporosinus sp.]|nr:zinc ribbon domain-containing protein [Desulfosporosinus sp.]